MTSDNRGQRTAYMALKPGTPVYDIAGERLGKLRNVLAVEEKDVFDGILVHEGAFGQRFVDADMIGDLFEHRIELKISAEEFERQPEHANGTAAFEPRGGKTPLDFLRGRDYWRRDDEPGPG